MDEMEEYLQRPAYLAGTVAAMHAVLSRVVQQLPERAMLSAVEAARHHYAWAQKSADETGNTLRIDFAAAAWDLAERLNEAVEQQIDELESGATLRTVQPSPIPREEWITETSGY